MRIDFSIFDIAFFRSLTDDYRIAFIHPADFLRLAPPIAERIASEERRTTISSLLDRKEPLESFPVLEIEIDGDDAYVVNHDGRHRALELASRSVPHIPVLLEFSAGNAVDLATVARIHPQEHDDDDHYPGYDEESLHEKAMPVPLSFLGPLSKPSEIALDLRLVALDKRLERLGAGALEVSECREIVRSVLDEPGETARHMLYAALRDLTARVLRTPQTGAEYVSALHNLMLAVKANIGNPWSDRVSPLAEMLYEHNNMLINQSPHMRMVQARN